MSAGWAAFLDRDGVLNEHVDLLCRPEDLRLIPGADRAVRRVREAGGLAIVVTNQPVVARGLVDEQGLAVIHRRLEELLAAGGARLDAILYCPHHPEAHHPEAADPRYRRECGCRKPKTGLIDEAVRRFGVDVSRSFVVGDSTRDIQLARNAGCPGLLVRTGNGGKDGLFPALPDRVFDHVDEAVEWALRARAGK